jgi:peptidoglycan/LPS O-acetylase OafA/YrhL
MDAFVAPELAAGNGPRAPAVSLAGPYRKDVPPLTGLRFVAAFSVLLGHGFGWMLKSHETPLGAIYWIEQSSGFGMTLFFVLSGFVIHYNYATLVTEGGLRGIRSFLWARFARLYPLFLLMMIVYVLLSSRHFDLWMGHPERINSTLRALPYFLLSMQSWFYAIIDGNPLINAIGGGSPITWSISTEWFFYLAYLGIAWVVPRSRAPLIGLVSILLWCVLWITIATSLYERSPQIDAWAVAHFGPVAGIQNGEQDTFVRWLLFYSPYLRIGEFLLGSLVAQFYIRLRNWEVSSWEHVIGAGGFLVAGGSAILVTYLNYSPNVGMNIFREMNMNFALAPSAAMLIFCGARYHGTAMRILTLRPILALGEASYSIYLVHIVIFTSALRLTGSTVHSLVYDVVKLLLLTTIVLVVSFLLYAYYEAPVRKWLRRWADKRSSLAASADAPQSSTP